MTRGNKAYATSSLVILVCLVHKQLHSLPRHNATVVSYKVDNELPLRALAQIALRTGVPVGLAVGEDTQSLCRTVKSFDIEEKDPLDALTEIAKSSGLSSSVKDGVLILTAADMTPLQISILDHHFVSYPQQSSSSMAGLGARLTGAIRMEMGNETTFAASILHSVDSQHATIPESSGLSTEEIAGRIVNQGAHGLWIFHGATPAVERGAETPGRPQDAEVRVFSYVDDKQALETLSCAF